MTDPAGSRTIFRLIEPRRPRRGEVEFDVGMLLEPVLILLMGVEIIQDDVKFAARVGFDDARSRSRGTRRGGDALCASR